MDVVVLPIRYSLFAIRYPLGEALPAHGPGRCCRVHGSAGGTHWTAEAPDADRHRRADRRSPGSGTRRRSLRDLFVADEIFSAPGAFALRLGRAARLLLLLRALGFFLAHGWRHLRARAGRRAKAGNEGPAARPLAEPLRGRRQVAVGISRQEGLVRRHRVERDGG